MYENLFDRIRQAALSGAGHVDIDFARCEFMSSEMMSTLLRAHRLAASLGVELRLLNVSPNIRDIFQITKLGKLFRIID